MTKNRITVDGTLSAWNIHVTWWTAVGSQSIVFRSLTVNHVCPPLCTFGVCTPVHMGPVCYPPYYLSTCNRKLSPPMRDLGTPPWPPPRIKTGRRCNVTISRRTTQCISLTFETSNYVNFRCKVAWCPTQDSVWNKPELVSSMKFIW